MMKNILRVFLLLLVLSLVCTAALGEMTITKKNKAFSDAALSVENGILSYAFTAPEYQYLTLKYKTSDESGTVVIEGADGQFSGSIPLLYTIEAKTATLTVLSMNQKELFAMRVQLTASAAEAPKDEKGAVGRVDDLVLTAGANSMSYRFTASGRNSVSLSFRTVAQRGTVIFYPDENGVFSGTLSLPYAHASDLITVTLKASNGRKLAEAQERLAFEAQEIGDTSADGPLSGVIVCLDPGHQSLPVSVARVQKMPGSNETAKGGSAGQAQGCVTLRKESIVVLEIAYKACQALRELGATVYMTRWKEEVSVTNMERAAYANEMNADYFIRIHLNLADSKTADAIYVYSPKNSAYAKEAADEETYRSMTTALLEALKTATGVEGGRTRFSDQFIANNWAKMPAFLIEAGFMSTPANDLLCSFAPYQQRIADGIAQGVVEMERIKHESANRFD